MEEKKLKPEEMPEYQGVLWQAVIKGMRQMDPNITDEQIIEELEAL